MHDFQFMNADDVRGLGQKFVTVRPSGWPHIIMFCVCALLALGLSGTLVLHYYQDDVLVYMPEVIADLAGDIDSGLVIVCWWVLPFAIIFMLLGKACYKKTLNPRGWLVKASAEGLFLQYRSYMNQNFDPLDNTVFFVPASKISWVQEMRYQQIKKRRDKAEASFMKVLDIAVEGNDLQALRDEIAAEAERLTVKKSRWGDKPVTVNADGTIRVHWTGMRPKIEAFTKYLRRWYAVKPMRRGENIEVNDFAQKL